MQSKQAAALCCARLHSLVELRKSPEDRRTLLHLMMRCDDGDFLLELLPKMVQLKEILNAQDMDKRQSPEMLIGHSLFQDDALSMSNLKGSRAATLKKQLSTQTQTAMSGEWEDCFDRSCGEGTDPSGLRGA